MKKKLLSVILAALMLASAGTMFSCSESTGNAETTADGGAAPSAAEEVVEEVETEPEVIKPDLAEDLKFTGSTFTFGVVDNANARNFLVMEELTGEALNDAQFSVIEDAQEQLDITIEQFVLTTGYPAANSLTPLIAAGDDVIQVANVFCVDATTLMNGGQIQDYKNLPHVDLEKPYWDKSVNNELMIGNMRYAAIGDLSISTHDLTYILLFNKQLITDHGMDNPYDLVSSGKWTVDTMAAMMEGATVDLNGDGQWTRDDQYGYAAHTKMTLPSFWVGAGFQTIGLDDAGTPTLHIGDEAFINFFEKVFQITYDNGSKYNGADRNDGQDVPTVSRELFQEGKVLFIDCSMFWVEALRDMEMDFGILPSPLFDEDQDRYYQTVSYSMVGHGIPTTVSDLERTGIIMEALAYYSQQYLTPAYYDVSLQGILARDEESKEMLDIIFSSKLYDFGYLLNVGGQQRMPRGLVEANSKAFASKYDEVKGLIEDDIASFMDQFEF